MQVKDVAKISATLHKMKWFSEMEPVKWEIVDGHTSSYHHATSKIRITLTAIKREGIHIFLHELAHHIEHKHARGFIRYRGVMHGRNFWTIYAVLHHDVSLGSIVDQLSAYPKAPGWEWLPATRTWKRVEWRETNHA